MSAETGQKKQWAIRELLGWTNEYLAKAQVDQSRLCAEILLSHVLRCQRIELYTRFDHCPESEKLSEFRELVKRCAAHEPVAYLTGKAHFYSLELEVCPAVLIPRSETETLVSVAIDHLRKGTSRPTVDVLDLCTGSGCIAIAIAANVVEADVLAVDNSDAALEIARRNIEANGLAGRVTTLISNLFETIDQSGKGTFDVIVSNPPYISAKEFDKLHANVRDYEPRQALQGGGDGLAFYQRILDSAREYLADEAMLMVEVGYDQGKDVVELFEKSGYLTSVETVKDDIGHQRVVKGRKR
jgi:release factor glutamine methyltransferase